MSATVTTADREKARAIWQSGKFQPDAIAQAIAEAREEAEALAQSAEEDCQRAITARQKADLDLKCLQESTVDRKAWDQALARHEAEMREAQSQIAELERERGRLRDALTWCSGSPDFAPDGKAREGWERLCQPLLIGDRIRWDDEPYALTVETDRVPTL